MECKHLNTFGATNTTEPASLSATPNPFLGTGTREKLQAILVHLETALPQGIPPMPSGIAVCSVGELFGGVERHILCLLSGLREHGVTALLVLFHDAELAAQARSQGFEPIILPNRNRSAWGTSRALADLFRQRQIRIAHVHGYKAAVICAMAFRAYPHAILKTEHGMPEPMRDRPLLAIRDSFYHYLDILAMRMTGATICYVTEELRRLRARAHAGLRVTVIPNGINKLDTTHFTRPPELSTGCFNLLIVGRLDTVKGHHVAIEALTSPTMPADTHLQIIGTGPTAAALRDLALAKGVSDRVHLLGFRRNVYDYLAHCDALLMPSLHEGLPFTMLEAMALGAPIIASRAGGLAEVIEHRGTGLLFPVADAPALASAVRDLHADTELRDQLRGNARRLQQTHYSSAVMSQRYLQEYRACLHLTATPDRES